VLHQLLQVKMMVRMLPVVMLLALLHLQQSLQTVPEQEHTVHSTACTAVAAPCVQQQAGRNIVLSINYNRTTCCVMIEELVCCVARAAHWQGLAMAVVAV
jgi:hypothetical protein